MPGPLTFDPTALLVLSLLFGCAAAGLTATVRSVLDQAYQPWLLVKPFSCDLCMSFWASLAAISYGLEQNLGLGMCFLLLMASIASSLVLTKVIGRLSV